MQLVENLRNECRKNNINITYINEEGKRRYCRKSKLMELLNKTTNKTDVEKKNNDVKKYPFLENIARPIKLSVSFTL